MRDKPSFTGAKGLLTALCVAAHAAALPARTPERGPLTGVGIDQKPDAQIPAELVFRDQTGRRVELAEYFGDRPILLHLVYFECPMLCNRTMDGLIRTLRSMSYEPGDEFTVLTVSFDAREGPRLAAAARRTALKRYRRAGAEAGWHFLTGDEQAVRALTQAVGFRYRYDPRLDQFAHAAGLIVLTPEGRVSRYLGGVEFAARDLRLSLVEASRGEVGSVTDQALLLCYQYDPRTGRYGLVIDTVLRIAGLATVAALAGAIVVMLRRERRQRRQQQGTDR